jgi:hypothetical protein
VLQFQKMVGFCRCRLQKTWLSYVASDASDSSMRYVEFVKLCLTELESAVQGWYTIVERCYWWVKDSPAF